MLHQTRRLRVAEHILRGARQRSLNSIPLPQHMVERLFLQGETSGPFEQPSPFRPKCIYPRKLIAVLMPPHQKKMPVFGH